MCAPENFVELNRRRLPKLRPGDRVFKLKPTMVASSMPGHQVARSGRTEGEVLAVGVRGWLTVRWDNETKLESLHRSRVRAV